MIPESFIQELLGRTDIVDVIERHLPLKKAGANFVACCPFHSEKTPSFSVSPAKQFYHCFGCGAHGSAIGFIMAYSGLGFVEAVEDLAAQAGLQVPSEKANGRRQASAAAPLAGLMAEAAKYYKEQLKASPRAIDYLKARCLSGEIAARYGLGYAPDGWQGLSVAFPDYRSQGLVDCGLVIEGEGGRRYDRFRDRVMFPILDSRGNVIGFGGRVIGQGEPKYLNSPETPLFEKGRELYGLPQARPAIREGNSVIVVEGYMDVVALAQHGIGNAVATLGTAITAYQVHKLLRLADRVIFCFDGDQAGRKAAARALEACLEQVADDKTVAFLFLPPEDDPDSFVRARGAGAFLEMARRATPLTDFLMEELRTGKDLAAAEGRSQLVHAAKPLLVRLQAPLLRLQLVKLLAQASGFSQPEIEALCELPVVARRKAPARSPRGAPSPLVRKLLRLIVQQPALAARLPHDLIPPGHAESQALGALAAAVAEGNLGEQDFGRVLEHFRDTGHEALISEVLAELVEAEFDEESIEAVFTDTIERLRQAAVRQEIESLNEKNKRAGLVPEEMRRLQQLLAQKQATKPAASD
ncbi:MAG TPA: DNA primase [Candidatus Desulfobacillus sp.]|nr:DNA primase [Candidatus Desulfobacillus sp.]